MNSQTAQLLEQHFDTAFAAPDGIAKLRELILTLAMQGKLVEQDPNDPPASELLREIEAEKQLLVKAGKIKKPKPLPEVPDKEVTHEIPTSWAWVRFGDIAQHNSGKTLDKGRNTGEPRDYITTSNLYWGRFELDNVRQMLIRDDELEKCTAKKNDLLICEGGEAGRAAVWHLDSEVCFQNHVHRARFYKNIDPYFAYRFFDKLNATGEIDQHRKGVGISNMSSKALASIVFPLPPLSEQHRIVARIDQLMARCDELEKLRKAREEKRLAVHAAAIKQLLDPTSTNAQPVPSPPRRRGASASDSLDSRLRGNDGEKIRNGAWDFIQRHFGELYTVKENVAELRKAILQLAVMGHLVPQDPNDPPASELLKEIEAEKQRLTSSSSPRRRGSSKPLPPIKPEEAPYELPYGWEWVRFEEIVDIGSGITKGRKLEGRKLISIPYLRVANVQRGYLDLTEIKEIEIPVEEAGKYLLVSGDLLITEGGDWDKVGRTCIWMEEIPRCGHQNHVFRARKVLMKQNESWLEKYLNSPTARDYFAGASKQTTNLASINKTQLRGCPIPLPPLPEQHRIVARIDQLMALCNTLNQQIDAATGKQTELLNAVMGAV